MNCPLCLASASITDVRGMDARRYHLCGNCLLIFADPSHHLSPAEEKARYETHNNSIEDGGYVQFLNRVIQPMLPYLHKDMRGLDYGSGPGPALSRLVRRQGIDCEDYDPFFGDHPLHPPYDFVFSTECFEHFKNPQAEIQRVCDLLKPVGLLGIMTERWATLESFADWYYTQDPTHVSFYHANTFDFLCRRFGLTVLWQDGSRVVIFQRSHIADNPDE
ncbi:MAG: class I SAM-dependent methyltransferase [Anaerolineales bacterium]|nr:MAG: class I SAM-dependent methyltransferase [Anaerolineales bacterium]